MEEQLASSLNSEQFSEDKNPLTDRELASKSNYTPHPEFHLPKTNFLTAGIISGFIGIGITLAMYMGVRFLLFSLMPFDPQARAGLDFLLALAAILLSIIIESGIALFIARSKQVISLLISWLVFFGFITVTVYIISLNTEAI